MKKLLASLTVLFQLYAHGQPPPGCRAFEQVGRQVKTAVGESLDANNLVREFQKRVDPAGELDRLRKTSAQYSELLNSQDIERIFERLAGWGLLENPSTAEKTAIAKYALERAHGLEPAPLTLELKNRQGAVVTTEAIDLAIAESTAADADRIRVYPKALIGKANNNALPQATIEIEGKNGHDVIGSSRPIELKRRETRVEELRDSGEGTLLIGDLHLLRGEKENKAFVALLNFLVAKPPKKLVIGGDVIDAPGVARTLPKLAQNVSEGKAVPRPLQEELQKLAQLRFNGEPLPEILSEPTLHLVPGKTPPEFTKESQAKLRYAITVSYLKKIKESLPQTETSFIVGNHDVPRVEFLQKKQGTERLDFVTADGKSESLQLPDLLFLENGELKKDTLIKALAEKNQKLSSQELEQSADRWFPQLRSIYGVKGSSINRLSEHRHYDLAFAAWFQQRLRDFNVSTLIIDPASPYQLGDSLVSHEPVLLTRDKEAVPNLSRILEPADNQRGKPPVISDFIRRIINFDQHVSASVESEKDGKRLDVHMVGAFSAANSNPGQRYRAAVVDPKTGEVYHVTFFDSKRYYSDPDSLGISEYRLAPSTRLNYLTPSGK